MMISDSRRLLFVHVQKTGGSTIDNGLTAALGDVRRIAAAQRHAPLARLLELEPGPRVPTGSSGSCATRGHDCCRGTGWWSGSGSARPPATSATCSTSQRNDFIRGVLETAPDFEAFVMRRRRRVPPPAHPPGRLPLQPDPPSRPRGSPGDPRAGPASGLRPSRPAVGGARRASTSTPVAPTTATSTPTRCGARSPRSTPATSTPSPTPSEGSHPRHAAGERSSAPVTLDRVYTC